jgi:hypothetical protein
MVVAQRFRGRAAYLRTLAFAERDVSVRQQLAAMAIRLDEFADELERQERANQGRRSSPEP